MSNKLWARKRDCAIYLPSVQAMWVQTISSSLDELRPNGPLPSNFTDTTFLNFLSDPPDCAFWWPRCLYSPGHTTLDIGRMQKTLSALFSRSKRSIVLADSGGFQISEGAKRKHKSAWDVDWSDIKAADRLRKKVLDWQEAIAEYAIILDVPVRSIVQEKPHPYFKRDFQKCLDVTVENLRYWTDNASGKTKFLNVIQGRDEQEVDVWYKTVSQFRLNGWALAVLGMDWYQALRCVRLLLDNKEFDADRGEWLHFLGRARGHQAIGYTAVKRTLRKLTGNKSLEVSFDTGSPFRTAGRGSQIVADFWADFWSGKHSLIPVDVKNPEDVPLYGLGMSGPIIPKDGFHLSDFLVKGKKTEATLDKLSVSTLATHNVFIQIKATLDAVSRADALYKAPRPGPWLDLDLADLLGELSDEAREKGSLKDAGGKVMAMFYKLDEQGEVPSVMPYGQRLYMKGQLSDHSAWLPEMIDIVEEVLTTETPGAALEKYRPSLEGWFQGVATEGAIQ